MKKLLALVLVVFMMILSFTACVRAEIDRSQNTDNIGTQQTIIQNSPNNGEENSI